MRGAASRRGRRRGLDGRARLRGRERRGRRGPTASACSCSRARRATATRRSSPASRRSAASASAHRFRVDHTEDPGRFTRAGLARYDAVVFLSTTGEPLPAGAPRAAFRRYIRRGGGFLGIHAASDAFYRWPWYVGLVGASFRRHAPGTAAAVVRVEDRRAAATARPAAALAPRGRVVRVPHEPAPARARARDARRAHLRRRATPRWAATTRSRGAIATSGGRSVYTAMGHTAGVLRGAALHPAPARRGARWRPGRPRSAARREGRPELRFPAAGSRRSAARPRRPPRASTGRPS